MRDPRAWIAILLTFTVCATILLTLGSMAYRGADNVPPESRTAMFDLIKYIVGTIAGYLLAQSKKEAP